MTKRAAFESQPDAARRIGREASRRRHAIARKFFLHVQVADSEQLAARCDETGTDPDVVLPILRDRDWSFERAAIEPIDRPELTAVINSQLVFEANPEPPRM